MHENIRAISYALYTLQLESSTVRHPQIKTTKYDKRSLTYLGSKLRNRLPGEIIGPYRSPTSFEHRVRKCHLSAIEENNCTNCILFNS